MIGKMLQTLGLSRKSPELAQSLEKIGAGRIAGAAGVTVTARNSLGLSGVWACANLISGTMSSMPFEIRKKTSAGVWEQAPDHPLHSVIYESPNFDQTAVDFWDYINLSLELWGNAYASIVRDGGKIVAMYPVNPEVMQVRRLSGGQIEYRWTDQGRAFVALDRDVFHLRGPGGNALGGMSTLRFGANAFSAALAADLAAANTFRNGLRPSGLIKFKEWLNDAERATVKKMVEDYVGATNAGRPFVTEGGFEFEPLSISPEDAQMLETRQFSIEEICRFFQVPPALIGHAGSSTAWPTSVDQQVQMFVKFYLYRRVKRIEQAVRKQLLSAEDKARGFSARMNMEALLRGDPVSRASFYQTMTGIGAFVINDVRREEGLAPIPGGDVPRIQAQNIPITQTEGA